MTLADDIKTLRKIAERLYIDARRVSCSAPRRSLVRATDEISEAADALELVDYRDPRLRNRPRFDVDDYEPGH